ncbi:MAG: sulfite exporter TauE/SafE family protein [Myxococcota bacterium]
MEELSAIGPGLQMALLVGGGLMAGVINTLAGGGSLLTVPLLVVMGLPGTLANGTNRVGILLQSLSATWSFQSAGFSERRTVLRVLIPVAAGALLGAVGISHVPDEVFERIFGGLMLVLLVPLLRPHRPEAGSSVRWSPPVAALAFFAIGAYAGAIQAGVGLPLPMALLHAGHDVVRANAIKVAVIGVATLLAVPVFAVQGQIAWLPALALGVGFAAGGVLGARIAVRGGDRVVRPVLAVAVLLLSARMLGVY